LLAGTIYDFHYKLKTAGNPLTKVVTGDRKKLDDKELWVKRYRLKVMILLPLVVVVLIIVFFCCLDSSCLVNRAEGRNLCSGSIKGFCMTK